MIGIIEISPSRIAVYAQGTGALVWELDLSTKNGKRDARKIAAQLLLDRIDAMRFERDGKSYKVPVGPNLAARIAEVAW